jgi:hypothetical protein
MKPSPILEELWRVKDELSREAGYDVGRIFAELRATEAQPPGCLIRSPEELQRYATEQQRRCASGLALNEGP